MVNTFPVRLELNAAGSWKLIAKFDAFNADDREDVLKCAAGLVDALHAAGSPGLKLRVATDESQPRALTNFDHARGWWPKKPADLV
jgi:hypothetical protein